MPGKVCVLNLTGSSVQLSINGTPSGTVQEWGSNYVPAVLAVPRVRNQSDSPGKFWNGSNAVQISYDESSFASEVSIDGNGMYSLDDDLVLSISSNAWGLYNTRGYQVASGSMNYQP
ncbi:MAG: hypothetical protein JWN27_3338 [Candidatus Eremiobacteraeota bacterium]|nr:hypothetical protein [Candidatus Eremiobacteraeota bacterium]